MSDAVSPRAHHLHAVLGLSLVLESASLVVAVRAVRAGAEQAGLPFMEYVRRGIDPTSVAVMMEDTGAVAGLAVAGACAWAYYEST